MSIRCPVTAHNQSLHKVHSLLVHTNENCIRMFRRQSSGQVSELLCESDHLRLWRSGATFLCLVVVVVLEPRLTVWLLHVHVVEP